MADRRRDEEDFIDYYGVTSDMRELDSDVNEDANREALLDESLQQFYEQTKRQVRQKHELTNVPGPSVFDAAIGLDEEDIP